MQIKNKISKEEIEQIKEQIKEIIVNNPEMQPKKPGIEPEKKYINRIIARIRENINIEIENVKYNFNNIYECWKKDREKIIKIIDEKIIRKINNEIQSEIKYIWSIKH